MKQLLWVLALAGTFFGSTQSAYAQTAAERLGMFLGTWQSSGTLVLAAGAKPSPVRGTITCRWSDSAHVFLVCDGAAFVGSETTPRRQLSVYTYDASSSQYEFLSMTTSTAASPDLTLNGNTWTYSNKFTDKSGVTTYFRTLNIFDTPDGYRYIIEQSRDNQHWQQTGSGKSRRVAPPPLR